MDVFVGIDVGGTFTDFAALREGKLLIGGKIANGLDYKDSVSESLKTILMHVKAEDIARLTISTTSITNFIATRKYTFPVAILMPGLGISPERLPIPQGFIKLDAAIDFRGREVVPFSKSDKLKLSQPKLKDCAVIGKFSGRNPLHEVAIADYLYNECAANEVILGHKVSSFLNFPRRINSTLFYSVTRKPFYEFQKNIKEILEIYNLENKAYLLTSDGGLLKVNRSDINPVCTVNSGPVGSTLGAKALTTTTSFITMDIGGTTTDFALVLDGTPLYAEKGLTINNYPTSTSAFALYSVALGGDSPIDLKTGELGEKRKGKAMAFGGPEPTLTDALNVLTLTNAGNINLSKKDLSINIAEKAVNFALDKLMFAIKNIFGSWQNESAYHVWEIKQLNKKPPQLLVGLGGGVNGLLELLADKLKIKHYLPEGYQIANAIGTALVKPTVSVSLHADTTQKLYTYLEKSQVVDNIPSSLEEMIMQAKDIAIKNYAMLTDCEPNFKITEQEQFNLVRGFSTVGRIMDCRVIIPADVMHRVVV